MTCDASKVLGTLQELALETGDREVLARTLVALLLDTFPGASRVGVWWAHADGLVAGPFDGRPDSPGATPDDRGLVAQAVAQAPDRILIDIESPGARGPSEPRSRIVVLIRSLGSTIGALDIESADVAQTFGEVERCVLRAVADSFGGLIAATEAADEDD